MLIDTGTGGRSNRPSVEQIQKCAISCTIAQCWQESRVVLSRCEHEYIFINNVNVARSLTYLSIKDALWKKGIVTSIPFLQRDVSVSAHALIEPRLYRLDCFFRYIATRPLRDAAAEHQNEASYATIETFVIITEPLLTKLADSFLSCRSAHGYGHFIRTHWHVMPCVLWLDCGRRGRKRCFYWRPYMLWVGSSTAIQSQSSISTVTCRSARSTSISPSLAEQMTRRHVSALGVHPYNVGSSATACRSSPR